MLSLKCASCANLTCVLSQGGPLELYAGTPVLNEANSMCIGADCLRHACCEHSVCMDSHGDAVGMDPD